MKNCGRNHQIPDEMPVGKCPACYKSAMALAEKWGNMLNSSTRKPKKEEKKDE